MQTSETINELATALAKAQGSIKGAIKDAENPHFRSKYADLASVWDACRKELSTNGLSVLQAPRGVATEGGWIVEVETRLMHSSGQWIADTITIPVGKPDAQGIGSALTYARRYALASFVGVAPEDDDGNAATASGGVHAKSAYIPQSQLVDPPGFEDWIADFIATADEGLPAMEKAWKESKAQFREFATRYRSDALKAAKAKASKVTGV